MSYTFTMVDSFLKLLDGGRSLDIANSNRHFISAYVTDTRLMGVLAVYAHWHLDNCSDDASDPDIVWGDLHQFFYIDCEEAGLETYHEVRSSNIYELEKTEQMLIGGLGANKVDLDESQLRQLMCQWRDFNLRHGLPLPEKKKHYDFIFAGDVKAGSGDAEKLLDHICPRIRSDLQLINYFLMRCFGRDHIGAAYLAAEDANVAIDIYDSYERATFCHNVIDEKAQLPDRSKEYLCESIVEMEGRYDRIISLIKVRDLKVREIICRSVSPISQAEAALINRKSEFINVYEILLSDEDIEENIDEFTVHLHTNMTEYENGRLFLSYRPNNDHVDRRVFRISEDVRGMFFLSTCGQLILSAYNEGDVMSLERMLRNNVLAPYLSLCGRYEFQTPVLYEFMRSDFDSFEEYVRTLMDDM